MGFFDPFGGAADVGELKSDLSSLKSDVKTHTNNNDIHVTASDKNNWNSKLDKNQGTENSGKVLGTNANGEVIPLNGYGFEYDEETKMLKYGTDPTSNLNQGIGLDDTLSKRGYAADAGAVGELKEDLSEITEKSYNLLPIGYSKGYSLNGLTVSYSDGVITLTGKTTARISRTNKIVEFSLPKGTYTISCAGFPVTDKLKGLYLVNTNTLENITVVLKTTKTFALANNTDCYLSIDCYEQCVFDNTKACVQIVQGENVLPFQPPSHTTAIDNVSREKIEEINTKIEELDERYPVIEDTPLSKINNPPTFITMFKRIVHIGDSFTLGVFNTTQPDTSGTYVEGYNRPDMMSRMCGNENVNLGFSGACVSEENSSNWWRFLNLSETKLAQWNETGDCYIIALGTNDILKVGSFSGNVDADINMSDYAQNAITSVGSYAKIIQMIREKTPKAKIFCVTIPQSRNTASTRSVANTKIKEIASLFGCYVIDLETYAEKEGDEFSTIYKNSSHNNALGYNLRARQYIAYIDWIIEHNLEDFQNVQFIGTDYDFVD